MKKKITSALLIGVLTIAAITSSACGNSATLNRVGAIFKQGALACKSELLNLKIGGVLSEEKWQKLDKKADGIGKVANNLADYLNSLGEVNGANKAEVLLKISSAVAIVQGAVTDPDLIGAASNSTAVKILNIAIITLTQASVAIAAINVPKDTGNASFSTIGAAPAPGVKVEAIKINLPTVPKDVQAALSKVK